MRHLVVLADAGYVVPGCFPQHHGVACILAGLLLLGNGSFGLPQGVVENHSHVGQRHSFAGNLTSVSGNLQDLLQHFHRLVSLTLLVIDLAHVGQGSRFADPVAYFSLDDQSLLEEFQKWLPYLTSISSANSVIGPADWETAGF